MSTLNKKPPYLFALVDCNNFYASCERLFNPTYHNRPVVVLSNNDGCVIARSNEAKKIIPMGAPFFKYREIFAQNNVAICSSNYALYGDMSRRVMQTLGNYTPDLQVYSIDEAFLILEEQNIQVYTAKIKSEVTKNIGIPISIGVGRTKTLAKIANKLAKKSNGMGIILNAAQEKIVLKEFPVEDIWGIGKQLGELLKKHGIRTAWEFMETDDEWIRKNMTVVGLRSAWELRGISCLELEEVAPAKKAILSSKSFGRPIVKIEEMEEAIATYTSVAVEKLCRQGSLASFIEVFVATDRFKEEHYANALQIVLPQPTNYTPILIKYAKWGLSKIFYKGFNYKKAGIMLGGLVPANNYQPDLFTSDLKTQEKQKRIMEIMDEANHIYGKKILRFAAQGGNINQEWKMKREKCSPSYTTRWDDLLTIKI